MECTIGNVESVRHQNEKKKRGVAYDTAWVARVTDENGKPIFPECVKWILETQNENGAWGNKGTLEETVYCVQALLYYHQKVDRIDMSNVSKAFSCFDHAILPFLNFLPELWVGKVLYCPKDVILSSIVSAFTMYNTTVWNLCSGWVV